MSKNKPAPLPAPPPPPPPPAPIADPNDVVARKRKQRTNVAAVADTATILSEAAGGGQKLGG